LRDLFISSLEEQSAQTLNQLIDESARKKLPACSHLL